MIWLFSSMSSNLAKRSDLKINRKRTGLLIFFYIMTVLYIFFLSFLHSLTSLFTQSQSFSKTKHKVYHSLATESAVIILVLRFVYVNHYCHYTWGEYIFVFFYCRCFIFYGWCQWKKLVVRQQYFCLCLFLLLLGAWAREWIILPVIWVFIMCLLDQKYLNIAIVLWVCL